MKILHLDENHPLLIKDLTLNGFENDADYTSSKEEIEKIIGGYDGIVIRSRFPIDASFIEKATNLKFIARVGAGLENIDSVAAGIKDITLINAPEGNRDAVAEHAVGMLLSLMNNIKRANIEIKNGKWLREQNRGTEIAKKTVGIIGYGNMGKAFAKRLRSFDVNCICYDIKLGVADENCRQVGLEVLKREADVVSLHTPESVSTMRMVDENFINGFKKPFWFINTARGKSVVTDALVDALKKRKILGAALDVLEYESKSFENFFSKNQVLPESFKYLLDAENVILTPHIAGWTIESKEKLAITIVQKIISFRANYRINMHRYDNLQLGKDGKKSDSNILIKRR